MKILTGVLTNGGTSRTTGPYDTTDPGLTPQQRATITPDMVRKVYYGKQGCLCGCKGTYSSDPRQVSRVLKILLADERTCLQDGYILYLTHQEEGERSYLAYLEEK